MARSSVLPVSVRAPWLKSRLTVPTLTPRPICTGLVPPWVPLPALACCSVWLISSENVTVDALKPSVSAFARLLPITSSMVWSACKPVKLDPMDDMVRSFQKQSRRRRE